MLIWLRLRDVKSFFERGLLSLVLLADRPSSGPKWPILIHKGAMLATGHNERGEKG